MSNHLRPSPTLFAAYFLLRALSFWTTSTVGTGTSPPMPKPGDILPLMSHRKNPILVAAAAAAVAPVVTWKAYNAIIDDSEETNAQLCGGERGDIFTLSLVCTAFLWRLSTGSSNSSGCRRCTQPPLRNRPNESVPPRPKRRRERVPR